MWFLVLCCLFDLLDARPLGSLDVADTSSVTVASSAQFWILLCLVTFSSIVFLLVGCLCCNRRKTPSPQFRPKKPPLTELEPVITRSEPQPLTPCPEEERIEIVVHSLTNGDGCVVEPANTDSEEFRNSTHSLNQIGFVNPLSTSAEVSIFPPPGVDGDGAHHSIISFEPLPTLVPPQHYNVKRPPAYSEELVRQLSTQSWFDDSGCQFPRHQLHYVKEIGRGWFGKVVEGEARGMEAGTSKVFVRILKEDASQAEKLFFLHEATPYRTLRHSNILRALAACTETDPYLLVFESCARGDLKEFLLSNETSKEVLLEQGIPIKMAADVATGLSHMIDNNFIHTDVAARNCLVTSELRVKIGDTGSSIDKYPHDYYVNGEVALPIRWCAPESLVCSDTSIQTCPVTEKCNVWSFGVLLWEIFEFGKLPHSQLTDDQVITRVFGPEALRLPGPALANTHVCNIMHQCWRREVSMSGALALLTQILSGELHGDPDEFNRKWGAFKPNHREDTLGYTPNRTLSDDRDSGLGSEQRKSVDSVLNLQDEVSKSCPSVAKSPSLENFTGSLENLTDHSWMIMTSDSQLRGETFSSNPQPGANIAPVDFQLGPVLNSGTSMLKSSTSFLDNEADSLSFPYNLRSNQTSLLDTDTEDELWRKRLERCEFSEKVKEKSKSVADLMVLTHIDASSGSSESSLDLPNTRPKKHLVRRASSDSNILERVNSEEPVKRFSLVTEDFFSLPYRAEGGGPLPGHFLDHRASERKQFDVAVKSSPVSQACVKVESIVQLKKSAAGLSEEELVRKVDEFKTVLDVVPCEADISEVKKNSDSSNKILAEANVNEIHLATNINELLMGRIRGKTEGNLDELRSSTNENTDSIQSGSNRNADLSEQSSVPKIVVSESEPLPVSSDEEMCDTVNLPPVQLNSRVRIVNFASSSENEESDDELERIDESLDQFILKPSRCVTEDGTSSVIIGCCDSFSLDFTRPLKTASEDEKFILDSKQEEKLFSGLDFENKVQEEKLFSTLDIETKLSEDDRSSRTTDDERSYKTDDDSRSYKTEDERSYKIEDERNQSDCKSLVTPDEDHSCDSGFRDKGSLSDNDLSDNNDEMTLDPQNRLLEGEEYNLNDIEDGLFQDLLTSASAKTGWYLHEPPCSSDENSIINKDTLYVEDYEESSSDEEDWWRDDRKFLLNSDVTEALRKELSDKLPGSSSSTKTEEVEQEETEVLDTRTLYVQYPKSLSPILEESETEYEIDDEENSLVLNLVPFSKRGSESDSEEEDILIVDTQSNQAILLSPSGYSRSGSLSPDSLSSSPSHSHSHYTVSLSVSEPASLLSYDEKSQDVPTLPNFEIYDLSPNSLTLQDESSTDQFDTPRLSAASQLKSQSCSSETLYNMNFEENNSPQHPVATKSPQLCKEIALTKEPVPEALTDSNESETQVVSVTDIDQAIISNNLRDFTIESRPPVQDPPTSPSCIRIFTNLNDPLDDSSEQNVDLETPLDDMLRRNVLCYDKDISSPLNPKCLLGNELFTHVFDVRERVEDEEKFKEISSEINKVFIERDVETNEVTSSLEKNSKDSIKSDKVFDQETNSQNKISTPLKENSETSKTKVPTLLEYNIEDHKTLENSSESLKTLNPFMVDEAHVPSHNPFLRQVFNPFLNEEETYSSNVTNPFLIDTMNENIIKENLRSLDTEQLSRENQWTEEMRENQFRNAVENIDNLLSGSFDNEPVLEELQCFPVGALSSSTSQGNLPCFSEEDQMKNAVQNIDNLISQTNNRERFEDEKPDNSETKSELLDTMEINKTARKNSEENLQNVHSVEPLNDLEKQIEDKPSITTDVVDGAVKIKYQLENTLDSPKILPHFRDDILETNNKVEEDSSKQHKVPSNLFDLFSTPPEPTNNIVNSNQQESATKKLENSSIKTGTVESCSKDQLNKEEIVVDKTRIAINEDISTFKEKSTTNIVDNFVNEIESAPLKGVNVTNKDGISPKTVNNSLKVDLQDSPSKSLKHSSNSKSWPSLQRLEDNVLSPPNRSSSVDTVVSTRFRNFIVSKVDDNGSSTSETSPSSSSDNESTEFIWTNPLSPSEDIEQHSDSDEEFVPSSWNSKAKPAKSLLKTNKPDSNEPKKNVSFKTQHYHCVYEYPRDPSECKPNHKPHNSFPDFVPNYNQPSDFGANYNQPSDLGATYGHPLDLVKFSDDGEFFIRSSMKPLQRPSSEFFAGDPYNFFFQPPGVDQTSSSGIDFNEEESVTSFCSSEDTETTPANSTLGELCHTKQKLKLDLVSPLTQTLSPGPHTKSDFIFPPPSHKPEFNFLKSTVDLGFLQSNADNFNADSFDTSWEPEHRESQSGSDDDDFDDDVTTFVSKSYSVDLTSDGSKVRPGESGEDLVTSPGFKQFHVSPVDLNSLESKLTPNNVELIGTKCSPLSDNAPCKVSLNTFETKVSPSGDKSIACPNSESRNALNISPDNIDLITSDNTISNSKITRSNVDLTSQGSKLLTAVDNSRIPSSLDIFTNISPKIEPKPVNEDSGESVENSLNSDASKLRTYKCVGNVGCDSRIRHSIGTNEIPERTPENIGEPESTAPSLNGLDTNTSPVDRKDNLDWKPAESVATSLSNKCTNESNLETVVSNDNGEIEIDVSHENNCLENAVSHRNGETETVVSHLATSVSHNSNLETADSHDNNNLETSESHNSNLETADSHDNNLETPVSHRNGEIETDVSHKNSNLETDVSHGNGEITQNSKVDDLKSIADFYLTNNSNSVPKNKDSVNTKEGSLNRFNNVTDSLELQRHCVKFS